MESLPRLYVFTLSHFCEKARWACDRKGMRYRLVTLLPGDRLNTAFARLDRHFSERRYLAGERFSRADLTLASLAAGLLRPAEHPAHQYPSREALPSWLEQTRHLCESATAERVRELYRNERQLVRLPAP